MELGKLLSRLRIFQSVFVGIGICAWFGCGGGSDGPPLPAGPVATVKGTLTCQGKPVTSGVLQLEAGQGYLVSSVVGSGGAFELQGPRGASIPVGKYKVWVTPPRPEVKPGDLNSPVVKIEGVPAKFYSPKTSGVSVEINAGPQDLTIELK